MRYRVSRVSADDIGQIHAFLRRPATSGRRRAVAACVLTLIAATACSDAPTAPRSGIKLKLCQVGTWFAYRNEGAAWTRLTSSESTYEFSATERLAIAWTYHPPNAPFLTVEYITAAQAAERHRCTSTAIEPPEIGRVNAVVHGLGEHDHAAIRLGASYGEWAVSRTVLELPTYADPARLLAARYPADTLVRIADRVIVRGEQKYLPGSTVDVDFASSEAFSPANTNITWGDIPATVDLLFRPSSGNALRLASIFYPEDGLQPGAHPLPSIPAAHQDAGDMHVLRLDGDNNHRTLFLYFKEPRDRTVSFGPPAATPTITTIATAPFRRFRFDVPSQVEYDAEITAFAYQTPGTEIIITATKEYFGERPATWSLTTPDLSGVDEFLPGAALVAGPFQWAVVSSNGEYRAKPAPSDDGVVYRSAIVSGRQP